ncbi:MAG: DUF4276 family protein [Cyanobacteriota bacterium]|nr:DUF4276 family protein [Cyanobacteriota bacterium]
MKELKYTLLTDGTSDKALIYILNWLLQECGADCAIQSEWADLSRLRIKPKSFSERISKSLELYPCDLLFIHRDAEKEPRQNRVNEIQKAIKGIAPPIAIPYICVIPVRMMEAWLLFDEAAIRRAADNPSRRQPLSLPSLKKVEQLPDPKQYLCQLLRDASGLTGGRLKKFKSKEREKIQRVAQLINDFSPLHTLSAFQALENDVKGLLKQQGFLE